MTHHVETQALLTLIHAAKSILLSTHAQPDGDGLGAEVALYHFIKTLKKKVVICNPDPLPTRYQFLDPQGVFLQGVHAIPKRILFDLWIIVDTNDPRRLGPLWPHFLNRVKTILFLDHHAELNAHSKIHYPPHAFVISALYAGSIGELIYEVIQPTSSKMNGRMAQGLYVSVMTDTNSFRYSRTTPLSHQIAAHSISLGINPEKIYQNIYSSKNISHLHLLGHLLKHTQSRKQGKIAWLEMRLSLRLKYGATIDATHSFLNLLMLIQEAEIICFFREMENGHTQVSLKSKGTVIISHLAMELGGGGHDYAAGATLSYPLKRAVQIVIQKIEKLLDKH
jgi:phosphoesterase RecJ-like protein